VVKQLAVKDPGPSVMADRRGASSTRVIRNVKRADCWASGTPVASRDRRDLVKNKESWEMDNSSGSMTRSRLRVGSNGPAASRILSCANRINDPGAMICCPSRVEFSFRVNSPMV